MKYFPLLIICSLLILHSCNNPEKELQLKERESALLVKEKAFELKKQEYETLIANRDSIAKLETAIDTVQINTLIPSEIIGKYNGKMICTETDCTEHVIGDQRNDQWEFTENGVKIINKSGGETFYRGIYSNSEIKLKSEKDNPNSTVSEITLQIPDNFGNRLKGTRELKRENCISKFSVDLEKIKTK